MSLRISSAVAAAALAFGIVFSQSAVAKHSCYKSGSMQPGKGYGYMHHPHMHRGHKPHGWHHKGHGHGPMYGKPGGAQGYGKPHAKAYGKYGAEGTAEAGAPAAERAAGTKDLVDTAIGAQQFNSLVTAVKAAELVETLKGDGPFTVFAPSDDAFAKLPEGFVSSLLGDKPKLTDVLTYHVVAGRLSAADLLEKGEVETLQGATLTLDQLSVAKADIPASNGIIHVIDKVLMPKQ